VPLEKPDRRATARNFELTHYPDDLVQRQVWLQFNQCQQKVGVLLQRRSLSGDGGFTMLMGDFLSLVQLGMPVKVVVFTCR
jgi:hypothetical protein